MEIKGEKLNFHKLFTEKVDNVKIPILQRDYAHGRESASEVRDEFLKNLKRHLNKEKNIDLDFIYGSLKGNDKKTLILLDGQQRITTLFLLHWYLANISDNSDDFKSFMLTEKENSKFTYETRTSSREFCDQLVVHQDINSDQLINNSISKTIKNESWFFRSWTKDPTIKSMLNMLDAIHKKFKDETSLFDLLIEENLITFQFLNLDKFERTDELYIKMNSRGKQLTPFENFKAKLEGDIKTSDFDKTYKLDDEEDSMKKYFSNKDKIKMKNYFSYKIDNQWTDFFWKYKDTNEQEYSKENSFDDELSNFIRSIFTYQYILSKNEFKDDEKDKNLEILLDTNLAKQFDDYTKIISFQRYQEMEVVDKNAVEHLVNAFDSISNFQGTIFNDYFYYNSKEIFEKVLNHDLTYKQRLEFFAYLRYLIVKVYPENEIENYNKFKEWMRVVHNLVESTEIPNSYAFNRAIKSIEEMIKKMKEHSYDILDYLKNTDNKISFFFDRQVQEERIKAELINKSDRWEELIKEAEQDDYYKGEISFLLEFSEILNYYEDHDNCGWPDSNKKYYEKFKEYKEKAKAVSPYMRKKEKNYDYLFERAVLTKGDYLLKHTSSRYNLLSNESKSNRNTRWKDLLRLSALNNEKSKKKRRGYIKELFDDKNFNIEKLEESLRNICSGYSESDWRSYLINEPGLIEYCNQGYLAFRGEEKKAIYLYKESQSNHYQRELYSYSFYLDYLSSEKDFMPFKKERYHSVKSRSDDPCAVLDNWEREDNNYAVDIRYLFQSQEYELRFFNRKGNIVDKEIVNILRNRKNEFKKDKKGKYENGSYINIFKTEDKTIEQLKYLCDEFNNI